MFGLPTVVEQNPVGNIPPSPQKIRFASSLIKKLDVIYFSKGILASLCRLSGTSHGTNLLLMIFLQYFSLSIIKQEARKSTMSVTPWYSYDPIYYLIYQWLGSWEDAKIFYFLGNLDYSCSLFRAQVNRHSEISCVALPNCLSAQDEIQTHTACGSYLPCRSKASRTFLFLLLIRMVMFNVLSLSLFLYHADNSHAGFS
jgi:hypothetical protein